MRPPIVVAGRPVGGGAPCLIVAELSANHNGSFERAAALVRSVADAGADAVKLQTYSAETMTIDSVADAFRIGGGTLWDGKTLHELYREAAMPWEWQPELKKVADAAGIIFFSTPFDATSVEFLEKMAVPVHKIASLELVDDELLACVAQTRKPIFLATGLATAEEIGHALDILDKNDSGEVVLLHCVSAYPARTEEMNIRTLPDMTARFGRAVGLSDHSTTPIAALAAVALGACVVEKHVTLNRGDGGYDAAFSLEPAELRALVGALRATESSLGRPQYGPTPGEKASLAFRRSLFVVADVADGEPLTRSAVRSIRPGHGLPPRFLPEVLGKKAARALRRGEPLTRDMIANDPD